VVASHGRIAIQVRFFPGTFPSATPVNLTGVPDPFTFAARSTAVRSDLAQKIRKKKKYSILVFSILIEVRSIL